MTFSSCLFSEANSLKTETYSATEIDSMFTNITTQQKIIQQLLDIEETIAANDELGD